jgi:primosomal replication protein N
MSTVWIIIFRIGGEIVIKKNTKAILKQDMVKGIMEIAQMMVAYRNALIENGMTEQDALRMTIAYQGQQMEIASKANLEEKKMMMSLMDQGGVLN